MTEAAGRAEPRQQRHDFRLDEPLGEGASAVVYRAHNSTFDVPVALKVWRRELGPDAARKFMDECRLHFRLSGHPNIVRLYWAEAPPGEPPWLATEVYESSLADHPPLTADAAYSVATDLLAGLAAIHALGHLHRDVKPANVLLKDGRAALCDLGIAMPVDGHTRDGLAGTPFYTAPELVHTRTPTYRSDVYSAAVTLRALLPQPFTPAVEALLTRAASIEPGDRPADATVFLERFRRSAPASVPAKGPQKSRRRGRTAAAVACLAALLVAGAAWHTRADPAYVTAERFVPFGASFGSFPFAADGTRLSVGSPPGYDHLWGAWLPGDWCAARVALDVRVDPPAGPPGGYGYAVAPAASIVGDQPVGWSVQEEWDGAYQGFFARPAILPDGASLAGANQPAPDIRTRHRIEVTATGSGYTVAVDGGAPATYTGPRGCGGLAVRVWGGAVAHVDHVTVDKLSTTS